MRDLYLAADDLLGSRGFQDPGPKGEEFIPEQRLVQSDSYGMNNQSSS